MSADTIRSSENEQSLLNQFGFDIPTFDDSFGQLQQPMNTATTDALFGLEQLKQNPSNTSPMSEPITDGNGLSPTIPKMQRLNAVPEKLSPASQLLQVSQPQYGLYQDDLSPLPSQMNSHSGNTPIGQMLTSESLGRIPTGGSPYALYEHAMPPSILGTGFSPPNPYMGQYLQQPTTYQGMLPRSAGYSPPLLPSGHMISPPMQFAGHTQHGYPVFMNYEPKYQTLLPVGVSNPQLQYRTRKGLSVQEIENMFQAANGHPSGARSKRDLAILALILDPHFSSGMITRLTFKSASSILAMIQRGGEYFYEGHHIELPPSGSSNAGRVPIHPFTAWAITYWILELLNVYRWNMDENLPLIVNSQPLYNTETGDKALRQAPLKRDAISKVFQSIKQRSGINCHKTIVATTNMQVIGTAYLDWIKRFQQEWVDKE